MKSTEAIFVPAIENQDLFSQSQKLFWHKLYGEALTDTVINRSDFDPIKFVEFLPNIWIAELLIDETNTLTDLKVTLFGTNLAKVYGERTNQTLIGTNKNNISNQMKLTHQRTLAAVSKMHDKNSAIYSHVEFLEENKRYVTASGLYIPMCKNSEKTNMLLGYVEVSYRDY